MNSTKAQQGNGVSKTASSIENDLELLDSLNNNTSNKVNINAVESDVNSVQQQTLAKHIQEIEQIQQFLAEQAKLLGEKVDNSFHVIGNAIATIANELSYWGLVKGESAYQMQRFGTAMKNYAQLAGTIAAVRSHNRNLKLLLETKQNYAKEYLKGVVSFKGRAAKALQSQEELLILTTSTAFDSSKFDTPEKIQALSASVKSTELMYRTTRYSLHMLEYLESEYNAWLAGAHHGKLAFPTMRTATISTLAVINKGRSSSQHVRTLQEILSGTHQGKSIYGRDLLVLSAPHITAQTLLEIGQDKGTTDITDPYALDIESVHDAVENYAHPHFQPLIEKNPALNGLEEETSSVMSYSDNWWWRWKPLLLAIVSFFVTCAVFELIDSIEPIESSFVLWCTIIIMLIVPIVTYNMSASKIKLKRHQEDFIRHNRLRRHLLCLAGYQYRQEMDTERKSYTTELVNKIWE